MRRRESAFVALACLGSAAGVSAATTIDHRPVGCVVAEEFPRFEARLTPPDSVRRARVFFRADATPTWYAVALKPEGTVFAAALPKPQKSLRKFTYYLEVADAQMKTSRTEEHNTSVVATKGGCDKDMMGLSTAAASVLLEAPAGAPAVPAGFSGAGVLTVAGAPAAAPAGVAGTGGGGVGVGVLVAGGAVVAGGAAAAVVLTGGDDSVIGTWDGTRTVNNGPLFANCTRVFNEHWVITQTGQSLFAQVESIGQSCGTASCGTGCTLFPFPWNMAGAARFVVYGGTQCILSLTLSGDSLSGSMSACNESPGMTQDVVLRRTGK
jgi:hypothetical protein